MQESEEIKLFLSTLKSSSSAHLLFLISIRLYITIVMITKALESYFGVFDAVMPAKSLV